MIYKTEREAIHHIWMLARTLGTWPGYFWSELADGWILTYDPPAESRGEHEGMVLL